MSALLAAAQPLTPAQRDAFLHDVATALAGRSSVGDGELYAVLRVTQRKHFDRH